MSSRGGFRGSSRGSGPPRGRGGFRGGRGGHSFDAGPPAEVLEMGTFVHAVEGEMLCCSTNEKIPYFNAPIFLENKSPIGKVDEILGPIKEVYFTIKTQEGIQATSFKSGDKVFIGGDRLLPLDRFLPRPKPLPGQKIEKRGGRGGRGGGRGAPRGARGAPRGRGFSSRGGSFTPRGSGFSARGGGSSFRGSPRGAAPRGRGFTPRGRGRGA